MKVLRKDFRIYPNSFYLIPTILLSFKDFMYPMPNFAIEFHFLVFHARILWAKFDV